jgi:hypothetical protein
MNFVELTQTPTFNESVEWTTVDEIEFLRLLFNRENLVGLVRYRGLLPYRTYVGEGMKVDVELVALALRNLIGLLEERL